MIDSRMRCPKCLTFGYLLRSTIEHGTDNPWMCSGVGGCGSGSETKDWLDANPVVDPQVEAIARRVVELLVEGGYVGKA